VSIKNKETTYDAWRWEGMRVRETGSGSYNNNIYI